VNQSLGDGDRKRVFSGIQPTGIPHLGNYLGALRNWVALQDDFDAFYCVVDLHALSLPWDPRELHGQTLEVAATLIACGVDPARSVLFVQSHVPEHCVLAWVLGCVARMGELRRMVAFKEKSRGETESVGVGVFTYPVLQAADVLAYRAHGVPVGEDQRQHIELMRDLAARFNSSYGPVFVLPEAWVPELGARIMALDDPSQKMSKSAARPAASITLLDDSDTVARKLRAAVTDSGRDIRVGEDKPALTNLLTIYSLAAGVPIDALEDKFAGAGYGQFKAELTEVLVERLAPIRARLTELIDDRPGLVRVLAAGAERAHDVATKTVTDVRAATGLVPPADGVGSGDPPRPENRAPGPARG
jgi:tryptophanyl-tRNA synthetase